ncbi:MotA/TolQ/ExbB proton channel [Desulfofundulus kuznetsovii DSM 6115]|uniref:MotA/TolQ/ExbB proton channel family protein n=2 Tax=Desulfofundulus TaxID=2282741 RepID=A0A6N7IS20_9FIRM|nr:MotA/TolQ/ExbB proton channel family protein [Desulfofundulus thermobenzoicus]AEG15781.1 MotA/TolQ/ExbB proton channel [Desulfofundulus kuznetsovii DSM 6115]MQL51928.1 MotA/TolQ/ExbB proton channel family protein [Desulfofundulus thermobenzoicus]
MTIPGSEYLTKILHAASQSLLIPDIVGLLFFLVFAFMELGSFVAEMRRRKVIQPVNLLEVIHDVGGVSLWQMRNLQQVLDSSALNPRQKKLVSDLLAKPGLSPEVRRLVAQDILDREEFRFKQTLDKTDLLAKLSPVFGLMGTLIPLGPGLAALGQGDVRGLSEAVIIAFDTTVVGVAAGAVGALISRVRRRWYEQDLRYLELLLELVVGGESRAVQETEAGAVIRRRS